jgi:hypothetical protein
MKLALDGDFAIFTIYNSLVQNSALVLKKEPPRSNRHSPLRSRRAYYLTVSTWGRAGSYLTGKALSTSCNSCSALKRTEGSVSQQRYVAKRKEK